MARFDRVTVYPTGDAKEIVFTSVEAISLINDDTYGPAPVFKEDSEFDKAVLYINPENITAVEVVP